MTFENDCRRRLRRMALRLVKLLDLGAPGVILAREVALLTQTAKGAFGRDFYEQLLEMELPFLKQGRAYCSEPGCGNAVAVTSSYPPICERCDAVYATEVEQARREEEEEEQ